MGSKEDDLSPESLDIRLNPLKSHEDPNVSSENTPDLVDTDDKEDSAEPVHLKVFKERWIVLFTMALLSNTSTLSWISFAPVSNFVNTFYGRNSAAWFSMVYMMCTIPVGIVAMWAGRRFGLRSAILIAGITNGIGSVIRLTSSLGFIPIGLRFPLAMIGQAVAAIAYPFIMFLPNKVAGAWFPDTQRALATSIGVMANPLGVLLANLASPSIVRAPEHVIVLNVFTCFSCLLAMFLALFAVKSSDPQAPPTYSASKLQLDFFAGLKTCFSSRQYLILLLVLGGGIGMFNCFYTVIHDLLCPSGYSNYFAGVCAVLMIVGGIIGAIGSSIFVDKTKFYEETIKISFGLSVIFGLIFLQLSLHPGLSIVLAISCLFFGVLGLSTYPIGLELASECTFPASETTSTGLIVLSGQIQSVIYVLLMKHFAKPIQYDRMQYQVCTVGTNDKNNSPKDNTVSIMVFSLIAALLVLILVLLFKPSYKRLEAESGNRAALDKARELASQSAKADKLSLQSDSPVAPLKT